MDAPKKDMEKTTNYPRSDLVSLINSNGSERGFDSSCRRSEACIYQFFVE
jgi:hypothetical protein